MNLEDPKVTLLTAGIALVIGKQLLSSGAYDMSDHQYKHIVCAIEPNDEVTDIVNIAAHLAQRDSCGLTLIHVVPPMWQPYADLNFTPIVEGQIALEEALLESAQNKMNDLITKASIEAAEVIVKTGDPVFSIVACAKQHEGTLVIMGVHNRHGLQRLLGSIAHAEQYKVITAVRSLAATMGNLQAAAFASSWPVIEMQEELVKTVKSTIMETLTEAGATFSIASCSALQPMACSITRLVMFILRADCKQKSV